MVALLKFIRGYVRIRIWGQAPERFINLCSHRNLLLWDIQKKEETYTMCISLKAFYKLRPIARKTGTRVVILERTGLPFFVPFLMKRKIFFAGILMCAVFWMISASFIWNIRIIGNYGITQDSMLRFLKTQNVKVCMPKKRLETETLEKMIRKEFEEVVWVSVKTKGTTLEIDMKERDVPVKVSEAEEHKGSDIVSEVDGIVKNMIVRQGVPLVAVGDEIKRGQILVEGKVPVFQEDQTVREYIYVTPDADITAEHGAMISFSIPVTGTEKHYTKRESKTYYIRLKDREIRFHDRIQYQVYDTTVKEKSLFFLDQIKFPLYFGEIVYREYQVYEYRYSEAQVKQILYEKLNKILENLEQKGVHIIEKNVRIESDKVRWILHADLSVLESVGSYADLSAEE